VDARSDVFGLGAILAVILTGQPPFAAATAEITRGLVARGKMEECFARLDGCGADPELVALCKRCLAPEQADRPADAGEVARAVAALRAAADERARRAELERVRAEGEARAQRQKRRAQLALAAAVVALVLGGGAFAWWSNVQAQAGRERQGRNAEAVAGLLDQCEAALRGGDTARAAVTLEAAKKRAAEGGADEWAARLDALAADLTLLRDLDAVDQFRWTPLDTKRPGAAAVAARYREALGRAGADPDTVSPEAAAVRASGSLLRERIIGAWDQLLRAEKTAGLRAALHAVDPNRYRDKVRDVVRVGDRVKLADLAGRLAALEQPLEFTVFLGESAAIRVERRRQLLEAAVQRRPGNLGLLLTLGQTYPLSQEKGSEERLRWHQAAVAAAPTNPSARIGLGNVLRERHDLAGAAAAYREAFRLDPRCVVAYYNLGAVLLGRDPAGAETAYREALRLDASYAWAHAGLGQVLQGRHDLVGAEVAYREAIRLDPSHAPAHFALGNLLRDRQDLAGAAAAYREAIRLDPKLLSARHLLGSVLRDRHDLAGAEAAYREAIRLDPSFVQVHYNLGLLLRARQDLTGAEAAYREAIRLDPKYAPAHFALGNLLSDRQNLAGAEAAYREAVRLDPSYVGAYFNLGLLLRAQKDLAGAEAAFREAIRVDSSYVPAHEDLGVTLQWKGNLEGAVAEFKEVLRLDSKNSRGRYHLPRAKRMRQLLLRLPDILARKAEPQSPHEACELAGLCTQLYQKRYAAARLYEGAFTADPKLTADLKAAHHYDAAVSAVRAASGEGIDPPGDTAARTTLRNKVLGWLRADLDLRRKQAASAAASHRSEAGAKLSNWLADSGLSGVRDSEPLAKLPAAERAEWEQLWTDVKATLDAADKPAAPPETVPEKK